MSYPKHESAFPNTFQEGFSGMSLRDWFAGQVAAAVIYRLDNSGNLSGFGFSAVADHAYAIADAMMAEREKSK